jgi:uncharacterized protein YecA (UPF0149 family)
MEKLEIVEQAVAKQREMIRAAHEAENGKKGKRNRKSQHLGIDGLTAHEREQLERYRKALVDKFADGASIV